MLTKKNKRMVRKMKKYIKTFPLTEKEIYAAGRKMTMDSPTAQKP